MKPDDEYLLKLGFAHYWFQYVEWGVIYAVHYATGKDLTCCRALLQGRSAET